MRARDSPDRPSATHAPTFSRDGVHLMRQRVERDRRDYVPDPLTSAKVRAYLLDLKLWAFGFMMLSAATCVTSSLLYKSLASSVTQLPTRMHAVESS